MGYDRHLTVIHSAAAQLTALAGEASRVIEEPGAIRIEIDITPVLVRQWPRLLAVLDLGDTYGLTATEAGQTAWLRIALGTAPSC
ncbi:hypothetical protein [Streptomyces sp. RKAG293]|uniref:hypothetical protein n=1 Tax=Streptomyces sp. RKAG293 TaxID=2893403 RepID=UPI00203422A0|nr:hypothetical protein [Streptomyces sp. RKAG293]MCM2424228.1 hypothetical protein [Streptomyces sp. RKAG293]